MRWGEGPKGALGRVDRDDGKADKAERLWVRLASLGALDLLVASLLSMSWLQLDWLMTALRSPIL